MRRVLAPTGMARQAERPVRSIACLAFVALLAGAFWAGVTAIARIFLELGAIGF